jgi:hypothetical protein
MSFAGKMHSRPFHFFNKFIKLISLGFFLLVC